MVIDWERRIVAGEPLLPGPLFPEEAATTLRLFDDLHVADIDLPMGAACGPWARDFARAFFGSLDPDTGRRSIREFFLLVAKKNFKSGLGAGLMLTALLRNWRAQAEFLIIAPTIEVARNAYEPARAMVKASDELSEILHVRDHLRTIEHRANGSTLKIISADDDSVSGKKASGVLIEELWLFGKRANAEAMLREATGGLVSRPEGFVVYLTTQSDEPPAGVFKQRLQYFRDVRDGKLNDPRSLPLIYEFPKELIEAGAHLQPENFYIPNPNIGRSVDAEFLADELKKAQNAGDESLRVFVAKHLNIEIGLALRTDRWIGADYWPAAVDPKLTFEQILSSSEAVVVGIDVGGADDMFSVSVLGRRVSSQGHAHWLAWGRSWLYDQAIGRRKVIEASLRDFERDGDLSIVADSAIVHAEIVNIVRRVQDARKLAGIAVDKERPGDIPAALAGADIDVDALVRGVSQGWRLTGAIEGLERKLVDGLFRHAMSPLMDWAVSNAKCELRGNARMITKQMAGSAKIDPLISLLTAAQLMLSNPEPHGRSVYETQELRVFRLTPESFQTFR